MFELYIKWELHPKQNLACFVTPHMWLHSRIILSKSHEYMSKSVDTVTLFFQKLEPKVIDPKMAFDPKSVKVTFVTLPKDPCVQVPWKYIKYVDAATLFQKLEPKVTDP